jgi:hypothetical protein
MATTEDRVGILEMRVKTLETWAGPGQAEALAEGHRQIRADLASLRAQTKADVDRLRTEVASLRTDLRSDMADVKGTLREILRRLAQDGG